MIPEFLAATEAIRADIDSVAGLANWVGTFDTDGMGEVGVAAVALDEEARLVDRCINKGTTG